MGGQTLTGEMFIIPGKGGELVDRGDNTYGGKWVINPSGGLISKGHPLGATGNFWCLKLVPFLSFHVFPSPVVIICQVQEKNIVSWFEFLIKVFVQQKGKFLLSIFVFHCCNSGIV